MIGVIGIDGHGRQSTTDTRLSQRPPDTGGGFGWRLCCGYGNAHGRGIVVGRHQELRHRNSRPGDDDRAQAER